MSALLDEDRTMTWRRGPAPGGVVGGGVVWTPPRLMGGCTEECGAAHLTFAVLLYSKQSCSSSLSFFDAITGLGTAKTHYFLPSVKGPQGGRANAISELATDTRCRHSHRSVCQQELPRIGWNNVEGWGLNPSEWPELVKPPPWALCLTRHSRVRGLSAGDIAPA